MPTRSSNARDKQKTPLYMGKDMLDHLGLHFSVRAFGLQNLTPANGCFIKKSNTCFQADCDMLARAYQI